LITLARELSAFDVVNIGAAGTFVVHKPPAQAALRAELLRRLPVKAEFMICRGRDVADLVSADPFARQGRGREVRGFVSVLAKRPRKTPRLPLSYPPGEAWQVKVVGLRGQFALSVWRRTGKAMVYPNEVVETALAVPATTRNWDTIVKICNALARNGGDSRA
jgi:uncharacterized protein (DUF1697 family)